MLRTGTIKRISCWCNKILLVIVVWSQVINGCIEIEQGLAVADPAAGLEGRET